MADDWAEWIAECVAELAGVLGTHAYESASESISETRKRRAAQRGREALAGIDILLLAALHDHVITEAERHALELRIAELLRKNGLDDVSEDRLVAKEERWTGWRAESTEAEFRRLVKKRASVLGESSRKDVYGAVRAVLTAEPTQAGPVYRAKHRSDPDETLRLFAKLLGQ
jgi:hypothetical protein